MRILIFTTLIFFSFLGKILGQSDSLIIALQDTLQMQIDSLGGEHLDVAMSYYNLGEVYARTRHYSIADSLFNKALIIQLATPDQNPSNIAKTYYQIGLIYGRTGVFEKAINFIDKALEIQVKTLKEEHPDVAKSYNVLGNVYSQMDNYEQAISFYNSALAIQLKVLDKNHVDIAKSYNNIGVAYYSKGNYKEAAIYYNKALNIALQIGEIHHITAASYNNLGMIHKEIGDYEKAIRYYNKALNIKIKVLDEKHPSVGSSYSNLSNVYDIKADYEKAISFCKKGLDISLGALGKNHYSVAKSYNHLGILHAELGDYEKAISFCTKALNLRIAVLGKKHSDVAISYNNLGVVYDKMRDYEKAIDFYRKALDIRLEVLDKKHPYIASSYNNLGGMYRETDEYEKSIAFHKKALDIRIEIFNDRHPDVATPYNNLGVVHYAMGDYKKAVSFFDKALSIWLEVFGENHPYTLSCYNNLADTYEEITDYETADSLWHIAILQSIKHLQSSYLFLPDNQRIKYLNTTKETYDDFYSFTIAHSNETTKKLAANLLLNTKSLALDYAISTRQIIDNAKDKTLDSLSYQLRLTNTRLTQAEVMSDEALQEKGWKINTLQTQQENLSTQILQNKKVKSRLQTEIVDWRILQKQLNTNEVSIDFVRIYDKKDSLHVYCAVLIRHDTATPQFIRIADEEQLNTYLSADEDARPVYLQEIADRKALYRLIWKPLMPHLEGIDQVHLSPVGILHRLPFESIQGERKKYLAEKYQFHYYSNMRDLLKEKPTKSAYEDIILAGHILYDDTNKKQYETEETELFAGITRGNTRDGIEPLKATLEEVLAIQKIAKRNKLSPILLTSEAPTEDTIRHFSDYRAPSIYHFATHGVFLPPLDTSSSMSSGRKSQLSASDNPLQRSVLMLYGANHKWINNDRTIYNNEEDGILTALEVTTLDLQNTDLVVLSACSTGLGDTHNTEGVFGLQRAFKLAGVNHVVASLWDVDDEATKDLMVAFYGNLLQKKQAPATALRNAKDQLREAGYEPENWAGFILIE